MNGKNIDTLNILNFRELFEHKRDCYKDLKGFIESSTNDSKICALYGLRRTGKTILMKQAAKEFVEKDYSCKFYVCNEGATMDDLENLLDKDLKNGVRIVFIDEITKLEEFQKYSSSLADVYAAQGMKIIITGTDSLGISLTRSDQLLDRVNMIHTTYIPFGEFKRLTNKDIDEYILYGGTLTNSPYKDNQEAEEYYNSAIVNNIVNSLEKSEGIRKYPPALTEFYDKEEIVSTINKMINLMNQHVTLKAVLRDYKNSVLGATKSNMRNVMNYNEHIDFEKVTKATKDALHIKNISEMETKLSEGHLKKLKNNLQRLDLLLIIPVFESLKQMKQNDENLEILLQPGMIYTHSTELTKELVKNEVWVKECEIDDRLAFLQRADRFVKGIILENAVIANMYLNYGKEKDLYVSKIHVELDLEHEADMILTDIKNNESFMFEVKYSEEPLSKHLKELNSDVFTSYIDENFGNVEKKYLIYNGPSGFANGVRHINAEEFFDVIYQNKNNWKEALKALDDLALSKELCLDVEVKKEELDKKIKDCKSRIPGNSKSNFKEFDKGDGRW